MWELDVCIRFGSQSLVMYDLEQRLSPLAEAAELYRSSAVTSHAFRDSSPPPGPTKFRSSAHLFMGPGALLNLHW